MTKLWVSLYSLLPLATAAAFPLREELTKRSESNVFTHDSVPGYELSTADPGSLGLDQVKQQAGFLGTPSGDQLFYWYFESRSNPTNDPVVVWLNGGPGCSSLESILFENGPAHLDNNNNPVHNPWSWNGQANVLFIDNPANTGYSTGQQVGDTVTASVDFKNAIKLFFQQHPELTKHKFHIAGESYAGRYIPVFATAINEFADSPVKVDSVLIGNGLVNPVAEYGAYQPMLCGQGGYPSVLSSAECSRLQQETPNCERIMTQCMDSLNEFVCSYAGDVCSNLEVPWQNRNPYDIRDSTCTPSKTGLCYPGLDAVQDYFNEPNVRQALGVNQGADANRQYQICNSNITPLFYNDDDAYAPTFQNVTTLLESGVPVLIYNGDKDIVLNWLGARKWTSELQWPGQSGFQQAGEQPVDWAPKDQQKRGEITNYENFTFLRVADAGHMVPHDQPESAYYMFNSWIHGDFAFKDKF